MEILDANSLGSVDQIDCDICIVGGGVAGLTIANEFRSTQKNVLIVEGGGMQHADSSQALYDSDNIGYPLRSDNGYVSRNRYLGGSSNTWAGRCAPLGKIDFEERKWIKHSGWPISFKSVENYFSRTCKALELPGHELFSGSEWGKICLDYNPNNFSESGLTPQTFLFGDQPANTRELFFKSETDSSNIRILLNSNLTSIETTQNGEHVTHIETSTLSDHKVSIKACTYILCCGGWENARSLLMSNKQNANGVGNEHDSVGRYYMEHPKIISGKLIPSNNFFKSPLMYWPKKVGAKGSMDIMFQLPESVQKAEQLPNNSIDLIRTTGDAEQSIKSIHRSDAIGTNRKFAVSLVGTSLTLAKSMARQHKIRFNTPLRQKTVFIRNHMEQEPNRDSRVFLGNKNDALGIPRLKTNLQISENDKHSLVKTQRIMSEIVEKNKLGTIVSEFDNDDFEWKNLTDSSHHIGTTRMSDDPRYGVVDKNCKVHGIDNLFVSGSSVFPTAGHVNPTFTIVALALKLADHIRTLRM